MIIQHYRKQKKIKKIKSDLNEIDKGRIIQKIQKQLQKIFYISQEKVIKLFNDYSKIVCEATCKTKDAEGLTI